jgi:hypothetical protein
MKFLNTILVLAILLSACSGKNKYQPTQVTAPNRQQNQASASCPPSWTGVFLGKTHNFIRVLRTQNIAGKIIINENNVTDWVVDGIGRNTDHTTSYTAICASVPLLASTDAAPLSGNGIDIQVYQKGILANTIRYVVNTQADADGNAFDYIVLNADGSIDQGSSDTYKLRTK